MEQIHQTKTEAERFSNMLVLCGGIVAAIGALALSGWIFGMRVLASINPNYIPMSPDTAIGFIGFGLILLVRARYPFSNRKRLFVAGLVAFGSLYGLLKFIEYFVKIDLTFETLLFPVTEQMGAFPINRMSPISGSLFVLSGTAFLLTLWKNAHERIPDWVAALGSLVSGVGFVATTGYMFGTPLLYGGDIIPVAVTTAVAFLILGIGLVAAAGPTNIFIRPLMGSSVRARMLRAFLPLTVTIVWLTSLLDHIIASLFDVNHALFSAGLSLIFVTATVFVVTQAARVITRALDRADQERQRAEERLAYQAYLLETVHDAIVASDAEYRLTAWNVAAEKIYGWKAEEVLGRNGLEILQTQFPEAERTEMLRAIQETGYYRGQVTQLRKDGSRFSVEVSSRVLRDQTGRITGYVSVNRDITERKQAEEEIAMLARFPSENPSPVLRLKSDGVILYANPQAEVVLKEWHSTIGKPAPEYWRNLAAQVLANHIRRTIEVRIQARVFSFTLAPIPDGNYVNLYANDITQRKLAEEELGRANDNLRYRTNQLEQRNQEFILLNEMSDLLHSCRIVDEAYAMVGKSANKLFPNDGGALYIIADSRDLAKVGTTWGNPSTDTIELGFAPNDCWALRRGRMYIVQDIKTGMVCQHLSRNGIQGKLSGYGCIPMIAQGEVLGVFHFQSITTEISNEKLQLAVTVAERLALTLASLRLRETLRQQAIRDPLTGLFNRRYMTESLERELYRAARQKVKVGVIMLDLDNFKNLNDLYGHAVGDAMLRSLGHLLENRVRKEDIACRYGGEEFVVILPDTLMNEAHMRAEQIRQEIQDLDTNYLGQSYGNVSASLGVAVFPDHGSTAETILHAADTALYQAKLGGRNRVIVAP